MSVELQELGVPDLLKLLEGDPDAVPVVKGELERRLEEDPDNTAVARALERLGETPEPEAAVPPAQGEQTWVVQRRDLEVDALVWLDVATVTVPPRTKRKTIVQKALEQEPTQVPPKALELDVPFRVLDADSAEEIPVGWDVPPAPEPVLRIG